MLDYLLVPGAVGTTTAQVWIGSTIEGPADPGQVRLEHQPSGTSWNLGPWQRWSASSGAPFVRYQTFSLTGLTASTRYPLTLRSSGTLLARADLTTLPDVLPPIGEPPFILMLGSCFCRMQDASGRAGRAFALLPAGALPTVKFLVGDQVYLDSPWYSFSLPRTTADLADRFFSNYAETWGQAGDAQGFNLLLSSGANYFCSDDHEFWNNAPFPATYAVNTWTAGGREDWWGLAKALYETFQTTGTRRTLNVGQLSVLMLDTRLNRKSDRTALMSAADFATFEMWVTSLTSPGILIVGQPIFAPRSGFTGNFADWNFPDFTQYADICRVLLSSRQTIIVLTGDVHYGRIASAPLPSGAELVEIISSPLALVDQAAGGKWKAAPDRFPSVPVPGLASIPVSTDSSWQRFANHFITLELNDSAGGLRVVVRTWETEPPTAAISAATVAERVFRRNA
jgi:hypothetical protein